MSLRIRLAALFGLGTTLALAGAGVLFYLQLKASLSQSLDATLAARADALRTRVAGTAVSPEQALAPAGALTQLVTADGRVLAASPTTATRPLVGDDVVRAARGGPTLVTVRLDGERIRIRAEPVTFLSAGPAVLLVGAPADIVDDAEDRIRDVMTLACVPLVALSTLAAWWLAGAALRPVERMRRQAAAMGVADRGGHLGIPSTRDELAALATTMNDLLDRLHAARARDRAFVADAGHELRTPLTNLKGELELALRPGRSREEVTEALSAAAGETDRLIRLAETLLALARYDADPGQFIHREPTSLVPLLERAIRSATPAARSADTTLRLTAAQPVDLDADPDRMRQAIDNLLSNAIRHTGAGSTVDVTVVPDRIGATGSAAEAAVRIEVRDRGSGFPPDFLPLAFERFARADPARGRRDGGAGLGLAIVAAIVTAHGGAVTAANHPDGGALVTMVLPLGAPGA